MEFLKNIKMDNIKSYVDGVTNKVLHRSPLEIKVRNATSNDPWGVKTTEKNEIAEASFNLEERKLIMKIIWERLAENQKNWRNVQKALQLLEFLVIHGSTMVLDEAKDNIYTIRTLRNFNFVDEQGRELGKGIRDMAKKLAKLLHQPEEIKKLRQEGKKESNKYAGISREDASNKKEGRTQSDEYDDKPEADEEEEYFAKDSDEKPKSKESKESKNEDDDDDDYENEKDKEVVEVLPIQKPKENIIIVKRPRAPSMEGKNPPQASSFNNSQAQQQFQTAPVPAPVQKTSTLLDLDNLFDSTPAQKPVPQQQQQFNNYPMQQQQQVPMMGMQRTQQQQFNNYPQQQQQQQMPMQGFNNQQQGYYPQQQQQQQMPMQMQQQQKPQNSQTSQKHVLDFMDDFSDFKAGSQNNNKNPQGNGNDFFDFAHGMVNLDFGKK